MSNIQPPTSVQQFRNGTHLYNMGVFLDDGNSNKSYLNTQSIELFSYNNRMNRLYLQGYLIYNDYDGTIPNFIQSENTSLIVNLEQYTDKKCGNTIKTEKDDSLTLKFFIDSVEIIENIPGKIKYKLNLLGETFLNVNKNIDYSTYGDKKKTSTDIIHDILKNYNVIKTNDESFEVNKTSNEINYITNKHDTVESIINYLFNQSFYDPQTADKSVKTLIYNERTGEVHMFDTRRTGEKLGLYKPVLINILKYEKFPGYNSDTKIGYTNIFSRQKLVLDTRPMVFHRYSLDTNEFGNDELKTKSIINVLNGGEIKDNLRYHDRISNNLRTLQRHEMAWNNDIDMYQKLFEYITQTNGLITNQDGDIGVLPGYTCSVVFTNTNTSDKEKNFNSLSKNWDIFEVEHYISPMKQLFKQKLILYRTEL